jgi:hypothetical protein
VGFNKKNASEKGITREDIKEITEGTERQEFEISQSCNVNITSVQQR